jgi:glycine/D-amino acid oxidase-like deaminating enzyme
MDEYKTYCENEFPLQLQNGVHLLVSQNPNGQLTIGDSHHYGMHHDPFQSDTVDQSILDYMQRVIQPIHFGIAQRWTGQYLKLTNGKSEWFEEIQPGVYIANGPGGAGMTLGWGMAEECVESITK